jgi:hypothetical protein
MCVQAKAPAQYSGAFDDDEDRLAVALLLKHGFFVIGSMDSILYVYQLQASNSFILCLKFQDETYLRQVGYEMCLDIHDGKLARTDGQGCGLKIFDLFSRPKNRALEFLDCIEHDRVNEEDLSKIASSCLKWSHDGLKIYLVVFE